LRGSLLAQESPVFRGTTEAVAPYVTVSDRDGRLVPDLRVEESPEPPSLSNVSQAFGAIEGKLKMALAAVVASIRR
jgi:hypothetical protein